MHSLDPPSSESQPRDAARRAHLDALLIDALTHENLDLRARVANLETGAHLDREMVHAVLDALHRSLLQRAHWAARCRGLLDRLKAQRGPRTGRT